jgi:sulfate transport system ATP-binding protein
VEQGQHFEVELPSSAVQKLGLVQGQQVRLVPSRLRLFEKNKAPRDAPRSRGTA